MVLLGAGTDGHTSSIFPGQEYLLTSGNIYEASENPYTKQKRIALTGQPIISAKETIFLITGKDKKEVVYNIVNNRHPGPAGYIAQKATHTTLYVDNLAAGLCIQDE